MAEMREGEKGKRLQAEPLESWRMGLRGGGMETCSQAHFRRTPVTKAWIEGG